MKLSIVIPVYNESGTIRELVKRVIEAPVGLSKEIIVVDDGSTDGTLDILRSEFEAGLCKVITTIETGRKGELSRQVSPRRPGISC